MYLWIINYGKKLYSIYDIVTYMSIIDTVGADHCNVYCNAYCNAYYNA